MRASQTAIQTNTGVSHPLLDHIESGTELPAGVSGGAAFAATVSLMMLRLSAEHAAELRQCLPAVLEELLLGCTRERDDHAVHFGQAEFLDRLGAELGVSPGDAEPVALAVFRAVSELLPEDDVNRIAAQLPRGLNVLWSGGHLARVNPG